MHRADQGRGGGEDVIHRLQVRLQLLGLRQERLVCLGQCLRQFSGGVVFMLLITQERLVCLGQRLRQGTALFGDLEFDYRANRKPNARYVARSHD